MGIEDQYVRQVAALLGTRLLAISTRCYDEIREALTFDRIDVRICACARAYERARLRMWGCGGGGGVCGGGCVRAYVGTYVRVFVLVLLYMFEFKMQLLSQLG